MAQKKTAAKSGAANRKSTAPRGGSKNSSYSKSKPKRTYTADEIAAIHQKWAIGLFAGAILLMCIACIDGESVWNIVHKGLFGFFGTGAYVLPLMLLYVSIMMAMDKPLGSVKSNLIGAGMFIVLLCSAIHIFMNTAESLSSDGVWLQLSTSWTMYDEFPNSGFFGALLGSLLGKLAGKTGAAIINVLALTVLFFFLSGLTLARLGRLLSTHLNNVKENTNEIVEQSAKLAKEKDEERKERKKQAALNSTSDVNPAFTFPWERPSKKEKNNNNQNIVTEDGVVVNEHGEIIGKATPVEQEHNIPIDEIISEVNSENSKKKKPLSKSMDTLELPPVTKPKKAETTESEKPSKQETKSDYHKPPIDCLKEPMQLKEDDYSNELKSNAQVLLSTLESFNVGAKITEISRGPSVTRYELVPASGIKISKITNLADDIALRLAAPGIRIEAPIPNKAAIGIEVPNKVRSMVYMREIIDTPQFKNAKSKLNVALGKDIAGNIVCADLAKMPHLLIAGTTGSGKSVCINTMIASILYNATPDEVKLLMIDPKQVEFTVYNGIAHLAVPVVSDPKKASGALTWAVNEMTHRYNLFSEKNVRDITGYNKLCEKYGDKDATLHKMHQIVIFIDELSDLMMVAPNEVEDAICRLAQMARAAGMHLVIATQRPSVNVITGIIKANIPSRIALSVSSGVDSRTIIDMAGAEKLLGYGDMLFNPIGSSKPQRVQGCFISDEEVEALVDYIKTQAESKYDEEIMSEIERQAAMAGNKDGSSGNTLAGGMEYDDEMFPNAVEVVLDAKMASTTLLQRKLKLGYARAARIMDELEEKGIIGPFEGSKPRSVLITKQQWMEKCALTGDVSEE